MPLSLVSPSSLLNCLPDFAPKSCLFSVYLRPKKDSNLFTGRRFSGCLLICCPVSGGYPLVFSHIAQTLATLDKMEQRGSGFARMRDAMLDHGLDEPRLDQQDGFFVVTLPGPDGNYDRIRTPGNVAGAITPAMESRLNERQKKMVQMLASGEELTSRRCESEFGITRETATRDFALLLELGIAKKQGKGRSVHYVIAHAP